MNYFFKRKQARHHNQMPKKNSKKSRIKENNTYYN
jgi:hypothetical protein